MCSAMIVVWCSCCKRCCAQKRKEGNLSCMLVHIYTMNHKNEWNKLHLPTRCHLFDNKTMAYFSCDVRWCLSILCDIYAQNSFINCAVAFTWKLFYNLLALSNVAEKCFWCCAKKKNLRVKLKKNVVWSIRLHVFDTFKCQQIEMYLFAIRINFTAVKATMVSTHNTICTREYLFHCYICLKYQNQSENYLLPLQRRLINVCWCHMIKMKNEKWQINNTRMWYWWKFYFRSFYCHLSWPGLRWRWLGNVPACIFLTFMKNLLEMKKFILYSKVKGKVLRLHGLKEIWTMSAHRRE